MPEQEKRNLLDEATTLGKVFVDNKNIIRIKGIFYKYNKGVWERIDDVLVQAWICEESAKEYGAIRKNQVKEIIMNIENRTQITYEKYFLNPPDRKNSVNMFSGILDLKTFDVTPYKEEHMVFHKLPFDYDPKTPKKLTKWIKFLSVTMGFGSSSVPEDQAEDYTKVMQFIQEFMGYSLQSGNPLGKNLIMTGRGQNGKGTLIEIWQAMLGRPNICNVDLREINNPSLYHIMSTKDKLVNFCGEASKGQIDSSIMKAAAVGEIVTGREIHKSPIEFNFSAIFVMANNDMPWMSNPDKAVMRRYFVLPYNYIVPDSDLIPELAKKIINEEIESIFAWALEGLTRLNKRGHFVAPERVNQTMTEFLKMNDNVQQWIEEDKMNEKEARAKPAYLFQSYVNYCELSQYKPFGKSNFYKRLENKGYKRVPIHGHQYFKGLRTPDNTPELDR